MLRCGAVREPKRVKAPSGPRTVYLYKKELLVARISNTPGRVLPTAERDDDDAGAECGWCSGQCLSTEWEEDLFKALKDCGSFDEFLRRMKYFKYRVENSEPMIKARRFMRL